MVIGTGMRLPARFAQALALYKPEQDREELWQAWYGVGQAREALGDAEGAVSAFLDATEYLEGLRDLCDSMHEAYREHDFAHTVHHSFVDCDERGASVLGDRCLPKK